MFMKGIRHVFLDEANEGEGGSGAAPGGVVGDATAGSTPGGDAASQGSVLANAAGTEGQQQTIQIPEKYQVKKEDGVLDIEASSLKLAEAYSHLEKRLGAGDVPPKSAEDYEIAVPEAFKETFNPKEDALLSGFLNDAHAAGLTQKQMDLVMGKYFEIAPQLVAGAQKLSNDDCIAALRQEWKSDEQFNAELGKSYKALVAYAGGDEDAKHLMDNYGNDPKFIRMMSRIGAELKEDSSINPGNVLPAGQSVESLMSSEAYSNARHPDHARVSKQVADFFAKQAEAAAKSGNVPLL